MFKVYCCITNKEDTMNMVPILAMLKNLYGYKHIRNLIQHKKHFKDKSDLYVDMISFIVFVLIILVMFIIFAYIFLDN